ncbi:MAG: hypothetical protein M3P18_10305, partial [Actinomycetota bacterium]|nr:hypothetical protein [Actinomycetota bacterium]
IVAFIGYLALTLIGLCSIMPETFATAILFGVLAFAYALAVAGRDRSRVLRVGLEVALAYGIAAVALLPYLVSFLHHLPGLARLRPTETGSIDMLSPLLPRPATVFGSAIPLLRITDRFPLAALPAEDAGYVGVALVLMVVLFVVSERKRRETWGLLGFVLLATVLSFGSSLHLAGRRIGTGLGVIVTHAPLLLNAQPPRFPAYSALALGVIAAIWLAHARPRFGWLRWAVVVLGAAALLPAIPQPPFYPTESLPSFITDGTFRHVLQPDETVFPIVPMTGDELRWQQAADFSFRLPIAYIGAISARQRVYEYLLAMRRKYMPNPRPFLKWLQGTGVTSVVLDDEARGRFEPLLRETGLEEVYNGGGVSVWRQPPGGAVPQVLPVVTVAGTQAAPGGSVRELDVPAIDASGRFSLSQDAGRPLVVTFYTEACECDPHLTSMQRFHMAHPEVRALAIDSFTGSKPVRNVVDGLGLTFDVGVDQLGRIAQSFAHPSPLPFTVMLAPDGRVVNIVDGALDEAGFESLFNDGTAQESLPVDPYGREGNP